MWPAQGRRSSAIEDRDARPRPASPPVTTSAPGRPGADPARSSSGIGTVADRPTRRLRGASAASRARPSASRSPRLVPASGVQLVDDDRRRPANIVAASAQDEQQRQRCSGVVISICGGWRRWLALARCGRRVAGARLHRHRQADLGDRRLRLRCDVDRQRLQGRDVERVQPRFFPRPPARLGRRRVFRSATAGSPPASCRRRSARSAARHVAPGVLRVEASTPATRP
jgi:hypothetical protein